MDGVLYVWSLRPNKKTYKFMGHKGPINDVCFNSDGSLIASASKDETVKVWSNNMYKII